MFCSDGDPDHSHNLVGSQLDKDPSSDILMGGMVAEW